MSTEKPSGVGIQDHWMKSVLEPQPYAGKQTQTDSSDGRSVKREREKSSDCYAESVPVNVVTVIEGATGQYQCDLCDQSFNTMDYLMIHKSHHNGDKEANMNDSQGSNAVYVMQGGKKRRKYKCDLCNVKVNSQYHLDIHRSKHEGAAANKFSCAVCERTFVAPQFLKSHMMTHSTTNTITCEICGVGFTGHAYLKLHMQLHSDTKKFKCSKCDEWFPTKSCVKIHFKKHTKVKNFKCDYCGKQFVSKVTMAKHRATHEAAPLDCVIQCVQCDRPVQAAQLSTHMARAHPASHQGRDDDVKRPYKCDTCGKNFIVKINLDLHIRVCHPDLAQDDEEEDSD